MAETAEQVCSGCGEKIYKDPHCKGAWLHGDQRQATGKPCFGNAEPVPTLPPTAAEPSELNQENVSALIAEVTSKDGHFPVLWISILRNWSVEKMDKLRLYLTPVEAEPSEPKADGFDVEALFVRERSHLLPNGNLASDYRDAVNDIGDDSVFSLRYDWGDKPHRLVYDLLRVIDEYKTRLDAGEQSGVRKGMQRALELCKSERLECHEKMMATGATNELEAEDAGYSCAINNCETVITAELAKEQQ